MYYFGNHFFCFMLNWNHTFYLEELLLFHNLHTMSKYLNHSFLWAKLRGKSLATLYRGQARCGAAFLAPEGSQRAELLSGPTTLWSGEGFVLGLLLTSLLCYSEIPGVWPIKQKNASKQNQIYDKENRHFWALLTWLSGMSVRGKNL